MKLDQIVDPSDLRRAIDAKLVNVRHDGAGMSILNYSDLAMYTPGAWDNPAVRACRGVIVDEADEVVARPWAKFFNYGQAEAGVLDLDAPVEVTDKVDGSLGILHRVGPGALRVATRGSFVSDQAVHATAVLRERRPVGVWMDEFTPLVEIVYPENRIVCDYGTRDDLVLLGGVWITSGQYAGPREAAEIIAWRGPVADTFKARTLREALALPPRPGAEGLCVRFVGESQIVKIKQEDYVALHRIVTGLSERTVWDHAMAGRPLDDLRHGLPDELLPWVDEVWHRLHGDADRILTDAQGVFEGLRNLPSRKEFALAARDYPALATYLFKLLDGRDPRPSIMATLRPAGDTRAKRTSEDVA